MSGDEHDATAPAGDGLRGGGGPDADGDTAAAGTESPVVDVTGALGMAGHEVEDLGFDDVADSAPVLRDTSDDEDPVDFDHHSGSDIATRGQGHT